MQPAPPTTRPGEQDVSKGKFHCFIWVSFDHQMRRGGVTEETILPAASPIRQCGTQSTTEGSFLSPTRKKIMETKVYQERA